MELFKKYSSLSKLTAKNNTCFITCKDHTVSGEKFDLLRDNETEILQTYPIPSPLDLPKYYQSEDYISHTDSRKSITDKIYQKVKSHMLQKKLKWIEKVKKDKGKILDIGAGTGDFLKEAKLKGWEIYGIEPDAKARNLSAEKGIILELDLAELESEKFDVITLWHVLEHIPDFEKYLNQIYHLLKKNGLLVIAVPNYKSYDAKHYKQFWAAYDVPRHLWHFSQNSFQHILAADRFKQIKKKGNAFRFLLC